jgi:hypothetical protein
VITQKPHITGKRIKNVMRRESEDVAIAGILPVTVAC